MCFYAFILSIFFWVGEKVEKIRRNENDNRKN
jgi:flagellar biosynthesis regulator FlaF